MRAAEFMAEHQGNKLMGQEGSLECHNVPNSLLPAVGCGGGSNAFPFLCLLCKIFLFFPLVPSVTGSQITLQTN